MRTFDVTCIEPPGVWTKTRVRALRERHNMSQPVFAAYLNSTPSTVAQWESGAKRRSKITAKLLQVLTKHGPEVLRWSGEAAVASVSGWTVWSSTRHGPPTLSMQRVRVIRARGFREVGEAPRSSVVRECGE